jgi:hypothetical protein
MFLFMSTRSTAPNSTNTSQKIICFNSVVDEDYCLLEQHFIGNMLLGYRGNLVSPSSPRVKGYVKKFLTFSISISFPSMLVLLSISQFRHN